MPWVSHSFDEVECRRKRCAWPECSCPAKSRADEAERSDGSSPATDAPNSFPSGPETRG